MRIGERQSRRRGALHAHANTGNATKGGDDHTPVGAEPPCRALPWRTTNHSWRPAARSLSRFREKATTRRKTRAIRSLVRAEADDRWRDEQERDEAGAESAGAEWPCAAAESEEGEQRRTGGHQNE